MIDKSIPTVREVNRVLADPANAELVARAREIETALGDDTWTGGIAAAVYAAVEQRPDPAATRQSTDHKDYSYRLLDDLASALGLTADRAEYPILNAVKQLIADNKRLATERTEAEIRASADNVNLRRVMQAAGADWEQSLELKTAAQLSGEVLIVRHRDQMALAALLHDQPSPCHPLVGWSIRHARRVVDSWPADRYAFLVEQASYLKRDEEAQK